jgi:hypothetical protein
MKQPFDGKAVRISINIDSIFHNLTVLLVKARVFCEITYNTVTKNNVKLE